MIATPREPERKGDWCRSDLVQRLLPYNNVAAAAVVRDEMLGLRNDVLALCADNLRRSKRSFQERVS